MGPTMLSAVLSQRPRLRSHLRRLLVVCTGPARLGSVLPRHRPSCPPRGRFHPAPGLAHRLPIPPRRTTLAPAPRIKSPSRSMGKGVRMSLSARDCHAGCIAFFMTWRNIIRRSAALRAKIRHCTESLAEALAEAMKVDCGLSKRAEQNLFCLATTLFCTILPSTSCLLSQSYYALHCPYPHCDSRQSCCRSLQTYNMRPSMNIISMFVTLRRFLTRGRHNLNKVRV